MKDKAIALLLTRQKALNLYDLLCVTLGEIQLNEFLDEQGANNAYISVVQIREELYLKLTEGGQ